MKKQGFNGTALVALVVCVLFCGLSLAACTGGYNDPDTGGLSATEGGGGKPAKLSSSTTADQAMAKLDEIINWPGVPATVKAAAQMYKSQASSYQYYWSSQGSTAIAAIKTP